jgi:flagellar biosynthetic protein FliR
MLNFELVAGFFLVFARITSFIVVFPIFGGNNVPAQVKAGISLIISLVLLPIISFQFPTTEVNLLLYILMVLREVGVGLISGLVCSYILQIFSMVGQIFDLHIGFLMASFYDQTLGQTTLTARFLYMTGIVLFFTLDGHHMVLTGLAKSFEMVPLNTAIFSGVSLSLLIKSFSKMITMAVQISAPIIAVVLIVDICLGLLGRIAPQMNIFMMGFTIKIGVGILTLAILLPLMGVVFQSLFRQMEKDLYTILKGLVQVG